MRSDAIGCISVRWDAFGHFRKSLDFLEFLGVFLNNLGSRGVLFAGVLRARGVLF